MTSSPMPKMVKCSMKIAVLAPPPVKILFYSPQRLHKPILRTIGALFLSPSVYKPDSSNLLGLTLLTTTTKQQNTQYPCMMVFWNFNRFVLRAPWTNFDDFRCKMTAFGRTFKQTEREKLSLRWKFRILRKTDFYGENVGGSDIGVIAKSQPKSR